MTCAALYAAVPGLYKPENKTADVTEFRQSLTDNDIIQVTQVSEVGAEVKAGIFATYTPRRK